VIAILFASVIASGASVPISVQHAAPYLGRVGRIRDFPPGVVPWPIADPGARFNNSDARDPRFPNRGLILGGCSSDLCVLHFEIGGIISPYCILAMQRRQQQWLPIWYARLPRALASFEELQAVLERRSPLELTKMSWCNDVR
jgi:hypothetical protein